MILKSVHLRSILFITIFEYIIRINNLDTERRGIKSFARIKKFPRVFSIILENILINAFGSIWFGILRNAIPENSGK